MVSNAHLAFCYSDLKIKVQITLRRSGSKLEHQGIRIDLFGQSEVCYERASPHNFLFSYQELARPGDLLKSQTFHFEFPNAQKKYESYTATNCRLRLVLMGFLQHIYHNYHTDKIKMYCACSVGILCACRFSNDSRT